MNHCFVFVSSQAGGAVKFTEIKDRIHFLSPFSRMSQGVPLQLIQHGVYLLPLAWEAPAGIPSHLFSLMEDKAGLIWGFPQHIQGAASSYLTPALYIF